MSGLLITEHTVEKHPAQAGFTYFEMVHDMDDAGTAGVFIRVTQYRNAERVYILQCHAVPPERSRAPLNLLRFYGNYEAVKAAARDWYEKQGLPWCRPSAQFAEVA